MSERKIEVTHKNRWDWGATTSIWMSVCVCVSLWLFQYGSAIESWFETLDLFVFRLKRSHRLSTWHRFFTSSSSSISLPRLFINKIVQTIERLYIAEFRFQGIGFIIYCHCCCKISVVFSISAKQTDIQPSNGFVLYVEVNTSVAWAFIFCCISCKRNINWTLQSYFFCESQQKQNGYKW